jgi:hypothetical protein
VGTGCPARLLFLSSTCWPPASDSPNVPYRSKFWRILER